MKTVHLITALLLTTTLAACAAPTTPPPSAPPTEAPGTGVLPAATPSPKTKLNAPHAFAHEHILEIDATADISTKLWAQYHRQIAQLMGDPTDPSIQVLNTALAIAPAASDGGLDVQTQLELFAGNIAEWSPVYQSSSHKVLDAYRQVLMQIKPAPDASDDLQARFKAQQGVVEAAAQDVADLKAKMKVDWNEENEFLAEVDEPAIKFADYFKENRGEFDVLVTKSNLELDKLKAIVAATPTATPYISALIDLNAELNSGHLTPAFTFGSNIVEVIEKNAATGVSKANLPADFVSGSFNFSNTSQATDYSQTNWRVGGGYSSWGGWFRASGSASGSSESLITSNSSYAMAIEIPAYTVASMTAKNLHTSLLNEYKNGPWVDGSMIGSKKVEAWGQNGLFPMLATAVLIVYNPSITMKLDQNTYKYAKSTLTTHGEGSYGWGPFGKASGAVDASTTHTKTSYDDSSASITIQDVSNVPKIVAVRQALMP